MLPHRANRFVATATALFFAAGIAQVRVASAEVANDSGGYAFFVAGHVYGSPFDADGSGVHPPFKELLHEWNRSHTVEFGFFLGDTVRKGTAAQWDAIARDLEGIDFPIHMVLGNHDATGLDLFNARFGETFKTFRYRGDLFVILDPYRAGWSIKGDQLERLRTILAAARDVQSIFAMVHPLIWWEAGGTFDYVPMNSTEHRVEPTNFWSELQPLFEQTGKPYFFMAGDMGAFPKPDSFMIYRRDRMTLLGTGMGGGRGDHVVRVEVTPGGEVEIELVPLPGSDPDALGMLDEYELPGDVFDVASRYYERIRHKLSGLLGSDR